MIKHRDKTYAIANTKLTWDSDKDTRLKHLKDKELSIYSIAKAFGCSEAMIHRRLRVLGLVESKWTPAQDRFLQQNYLTTINKDMARVLKVNEMYVSDRLSYLGLVRPLGRKIRRKKILNEEK